MHSTLDALHKYSARLGNVRQLMLICLCLIQEIQSPGVRLPREGRATSSQTPQVKSRGTAVAELGVQAGKNVSHLHI